MCKQATVVSCVEHNTSGQIGVIIFIFFAMLGSAKLQFLCNSTDIFYILICALYLLCVCYCYFSACLLLWKL